MKRFILGWWTPKQWYLLPTIMVLNFERAVHIYLLFLGLNIKFTFTKKGMN